MQSICAALVGYGYAGRTLHAPLLSHTPGICLAAVMSSKPAEVLSDWPGTKVFANLDALLADPSIDLVVIASPNDSHFPLAQQALLAGKHVVVDKPFTATLAEARQLAALALEQHRVLSIFQNRRWDADFLTIQQLIKQGRLGRIVQFESHFDRYRPEVRARWREQAGVASGLWFDLGPHLVDQTLQLFGAPATVYADLAQQRDHASTCDYFHVVLGYGEQRVILHGSCLVSGGVPRFALHGTRASYIKYGLDRQEADLKQGRMPGDHDWGIDPVNGSLFTQTNERQRLESLPNLLGDYRQYYRALHAAITRGAANPVTPQQAIGVMSVIELALQSAEQNRTVTFTR